MGAPLARFESLLLFSLGIREGGHYFIKITLRDLQQLKANVDTFIRGIPSAMCERVVANFVKRVYE